MDLHFQTKIFEIKKIGGKSGLQLAFTNISSYSQKRDGFSLCAIHGENSPKTGRSNGENTHANLLALPLPFSPVRWQIMSQ